MTFPIPHAGWYTNLLFQQLLLTFDILQQRIQRFQVGRGLEFIVKIVLHAGIHRRMSCLHESRTFRRRKWELFKLWETHIKTQRG